jgi:hypothetical protein
MGLGYEKIPACRNDCMLFWKDNKDLDSCTVCGESKWRADTHIDEDCKVISSRKKHPVKMLRCFPLIPRLQRLFMYEHTAPYMRWHAEGRTRDGVLRHLVDGEAWRSFDILHLDFIADNRNVRLGLTADGFNLFGNMGISHSIWSVMLVPYNLPPLMCMKQTSFILSLVIPGPSLPGMDIDVYLQPLIDELLELRNVGVQTFDASKMKNFNMRSQLMWTINDLPASADLSGWPNRGMKAFPCCMKSIRSKYLKNGCKFCYMGHRRYLPTEHLWRLNRRTFDGTEEFDSAPNVPCGAEILQQLDGVAFRDENASKKKKRKKRKTGAASSDDVLWKKKSIFFRLPYWKDNLLRHNLDGMHIKKNVMDNILGTILNIKGKTKDNLAAWLDLQEMGLRPKLHLFTAANGKTYIPAACHTVSREDKENFLKVL